jgi:hypothetical protein
MIDAKKTMAKLKGHYEKANKTYYLSTETTEEFASYCGEYSPSQVLDQLMKEFIESAKRSGLKSKKKTLKKN